MYRLPKQNRVTHPKLGWGDDLNGCFQFYSEQNEMIVVMASSGGGWEHVSVSLRDRTPTWAEMCMVKDLFWEAEDVVVQYHPAKSAHVNCHPHCLHLWRPVDGKQKIPLPPTYMV